MNKESYSKKAGALIRLFRKQKKISLTELSQRIGKSRSTVSKYELGEINIDLDSLYDIAAALELSVDSLLPSAPSHSLHKEAERIPSFYQGKLLYAYFWDNRSNQLNRSVLKIGEQNPSDQGSFSVMLYMNAPDLEYYTVCENTYVGTLHFYQMLTVINLTHKDTPLEHAMIQILENFTSGSRWALWSGLSFRPFMPVALKMLLSATPLPENSELKKKLLITKEDIRKLKNYNMLSAMQE